MRAILCFCSLCVSLLLLGSGVTADEKKEEKIDPKQLVGKWKLFEEKGKHPTVIEFRKDGRMIATITRKGEDYTLGGSYKTEGNKVVIVLGDDIKHDEVYVVNKLTETELVWTAEKGKEKESFTRLKAK